LEFPYSICNTAKTKPETRFLSSVWQSVSAKEFFVTFLAAEKDFLPFEINGPSLAFGNIALANRVLHQHLSRPVKVWSLFLPGEKSLSDHPGDDSKKDYIDENPPHIF
jgi:hypothetical protein